MNRSILLTIFCEEERQRVGSNSQQEDDKLSVEESSGAFFSSESNVGGQRKGKKAKKKRKLGEVAAPKGEGVLPNPPFMISLGYWNVRLVVDPPSKGRLDIS